VFRALGSWSVEKLLLLGSLTWSLVSKLPQRLWRIVLDAGRAVTGLLSWLASGLSGAGKTTFGT
jgi:hypothetical protein